MFSETVVAPTPQEVAAAKAKVDREYAVLFAAERKRQAADPSYIAQIHNLARSRVTAIDRTLAILIEHRKAAIRLYGDALTPGDVRTLDELLANLRANG